MSATRLNARALVLVAPRDGADEDVRDFLQGLVTNDVSGDLPIYAALLSAQGKAMFDFLVWDGGDGALLLDCEAAIAPDLIKRLSLYRLRRKIDIDIYTSCGVHWSADPVEGASKDPRLDELGYRWLDSPDGESADAAWTAHRLSLGVTEGVAELGDILWLETNAVELNGVSFEKGCYVGQENTARMNWRQKVNRRLVVVALAQSDEKRQKIAYPDAGVAVDHLRVADLDPATLPDWQRSGLLG
ncbi:MAG: folate-binding protein [Pseudomonadota bacterium]